MDYIKLPTNPNQKKRMTENRAMILSLVCMAAIIIVYIIIASIMFNDDSDWAMAVIYLGLSAILFSFSILPSIFMRKIGNERNEINQSAKDILDKTSFRCTKSFEFFEFKNGQNNEMRNKMIFVDSQDKKIGFIDYKKESLLVVNFADILSYEVYENGGEVTRGNSITGGRMFGKRSILATSSYASRTQTMCNDLRLNIRLKSLDNSQVAYDIISDTPFNYGCNTNSKKYRNLMSSLQEVVAFLEALIANNGKFETI